MILQLSLCLLIDFLTVPSAWNVRESSFGPVMMLTPGMVMHHCKVQNLKEIIPGKQKEALEGGRKLMLKHYFPDFKKKAMNKQILFSQAYEHSN